MKTYKFKLYQSKKNQKLNEQIDLAGRIWHHGIALHRRYSKLTGKHLSQYDLMKQLTKLKKLPKYAEWNQVGSQAMQDIVQRIERSYPLFFRNLKAGVRTAPPGFKKVKRYKSFTLKQAGWKLLGSNRIRIQGVIYKFSKSRNILGIVKTVTVKRDKLGQCWLYFVTEQETEQPAESEARTGQSVGFDFGLKMFLTGSDGTAIAAPLFFHQYLNDVRRAYCQLSRKKKGSHNRRKANRHLNRVFQRIDNLRHDFFFKLAYELTDKYATIYFEDLNLKGRKALWGRKVSDLCFGTFLNILQYVARTKGVVVHCIERFYPSSKTCSACGQVYPELSLKERRWACPGCGVSHDRDFNAALNIQRVGASTYGVSEVRLACQRSPSIPESHGL
ncbi:MAG: transposase [Caldilineaceae bacterium]